MFVCFLFIYIYLLFFKISKEIFEMHIQYFRTFTQCHLVKKINYLNLEIFIHIYDGKLPVLVLCKLLCEVLLCKLLCKLLRELLLCKL